MLLAGSHLLLGMSTGFLITITVFLFQKYILVYFYIYLVFFGGVLFLFFKFTSHEIHLLKVQNLVVFVCSYDYTTVTII